MPFELHADYDRDGRLTASASEYAKRKILPGAIILPNLDHDGRALPAKVESGKAIDPDFKRPSSVAQDKEPVPIRVVVTPPDNPADCVLFLRAEGALGNLIRVRDEKLRLIPINPEGRKTDFIVPATGPSTDLFVEAITVGGTPRTDYPDDPNPRQLVLELWCQRSGRGSLVDSGIFQVPPVFVIDDLAPAERLYIAQADNEENVPSLRDIEREIKGTNVPMVIIPEEVNYEDVWVQDQFQVAFCETPAGPLRMVIHCPRARANAIWIEQSLNLAVMVQSHFPSTDLAVLGDLLDRIFPFRDIAGTRQFISLIDSQHAYLEMGSVFRYRRILLELALFLSGKLKDPAPTNAVIGKLTELPTIGLEDAHRQMVKVVELLDKVIGDLKKEQSEADFQAQLDLFAKRARAWKARADRAAPNPRTGVIEIPVSATKRVEIESAAADTLFDLLSTAHDTLTYGGNIECSPPFGNAKQGKVVIGTAADGSGAIDPDVLRFFLSQDVPVVELDSTWLHVGHIDEFMGFVASPKAPAGFVIAKASAKFGVDLIDAARALYLSGLPQGHDHVVFEGSHVRFQRLTSDGPHPVTMMLRGQQWLHLHPKEAFEPLEPPAFFKDFSLHAHFSLAEPDWDKNNDRFVPGPLEESMYFPAGKRKYPARMSVLEWNFVDDATNEEIEDQVLTPLDARIVEGFPEVPLLKLPVLLDRVPKSPKADDKGKVLRNVSRTVKTFLPNAVNFQTVGDRILVPRPYAPRMRPDDVDVVLKTVFAAHNIKKSLPTLNESYFKKRRLLNSTVWLNSDLDFRLAGSPNQLNIAKLFRDGFPKKMRPEEILHLIRTANPGSFRTDGQMRSGWQGLTIPDGTVDLFEAAIQVQFESVGATPRFVDSWHYHIHGGQIHCGTNVLRKPRPVLKGEEKKAG